MKTPVVISFIVLAVLLTPYVKGGDPDSMELRMLKFLGLKTRPRPKPNATAPQYMWDMYHMMNVGNMRESGKGNDDGCKFSDSGIPGNIVRSFPNKGKHAKIVTNNDCSIHQILSFNLSSLLPNEHLTSAQIRLDFLQTLHDLGIEGTVRISLYEFLTSNDNHVKSDHFDQVSGLPKERLRLIKELIFETQYEQQPDFYVDILNLANRWRIKTKSHGFHMIINFPQSTSMSSCGRFLTTLTNSGKNTLVNMVTVSVDGEQCNKRTKRSAEVRKNGLKSRSNNLCKRHPLYVGFRDVRWDDWIIAPSGYQAYYCAGECPFPLNERLNGTNHAVIQTLLKVRKVDSVPDVCCAPTRLSPISLLYFDNNDNVILRQYADMIVEDCGCR